MYLFQQKLKYIKERLKMWNRESFRNIMLEKHKLEKQLEEIQSQKMMEGYSEEEKNVEQALM